MSTFFDDPPTEHSKAKKLSWVRLWTFKIWTTMAPRLTFSVGVANHHLFVLKLLRHRVLINAVDFSMAFDPGKKGKEF